MSDWQDISTAPTGPVIKGGTFGPMVLLASTSGQRAIGYWGNGASGETGWINPHDHLLMRYWNAFTHWMPLPAPSEAAP